MRWGAQMQANLWVKFAKEVYQRAVYLLESVRTKGTHPNLANENLHMVWDYWREMLLAMQN